MKAMASMKMKFFSLFILTLNQILNITSSEILYSKCFETQVYCQSLPENCFKQNISCNTLLIASPHSGDNRVEFELFGKVSPKTQWFAMALSEDQKMGDDSVIDVFVSSDDKRKALRLSWNSGHKNIDNKLVQGPTDGITPVGDVVVSEGIISAKWLRDAVIDDHKKTFDIIKNNYYILLANGAVKGDDSKGYHQSRAPSESKVDLQFNTQNQLKDIYSECIDNKTNLCFGFPDNCLDSEKCDLVFKITNTGYGLSDGTVGFQMIGKPDKASSGWIAMGLSSDNSMGNDSVVECLILKSGKTMFRNSWNNGYSNQVINDVVGVKPAGPVVYNNGWIDCKWTREAYTSVKDNEFDLNSNKYYVLLAKGNIKDESTGEKKYHGNTKVMSNTSISFSADTSSPTTSTPEGSTVVPSKLSQAYERCLRSPPERLCFGSTVGCIQSKDCNLLFSSVSVDKNEGNIEIELFWDRGSSSDHWAAVGLSHDNNMGEDSVTECILSTNGVVRLGKGWNPGKKSHTINVVDNSTSVIDASHTDGFVYCHWSRKGYSVIEGHQFDLKNSTFHIFLAHGPMNSDESNINKHSFVVKSEAYNLQDVGIMSTAPVDIKVKIHGALMTIAWLGCVSIAILMARHYKNSWPDTTICGVKIWFAFHRALMITAVVLIIISTALIFVYADGWSGSYAHPIVGLTSIILSILNPIGALFRPNPDSPKRWIFNWAHWAGGYIGHILAFTAICLATKIPNIETIIPKQFLWVLISYLVFYILSHLLHHLRSFIKRDNSFKQNRETTLDILQLVLNCLIILAFVMAFVILLYI